MLLDYARMRKAVERLYEDVCTVFAQGGPVEDPETLETVTETVVLYENEPCRISFLTSDVDDGDQSDSGAQRAKLFVGPAVEIPPGSRVDVVRNGETLSFAFTEFPAVYRSHREYTLTRKDRYL